MKQSKRKTSTADAIRLWTALCAMAGFSVAVALPGLCGPAARPASPAAAVTKPAAPATSEPAGAGSGMDMSDILGPDSALKAKGEIQMVFGDEGMSSFTAVRDVVLLTKDMKMLCQHMTYDGTNGKITALGEKGDPVRVTMMNMNPMGGGNKQKGTTYATSGRYEYFVKMQRHILTIDPVIHNEDEQGKRTQISGKIIEFNQDKSGRWHMHVKEGLIGPREMEKELQKAEQQRGIIKPPTMQIETRTPTVSTSSPPSKAGTSPKAVKIDEGSVEDVKRPKSARQIKIEEGG